MPNCSVVGCSNSYKSGHRIFRFPSGKCDIDRRNIWISKIKRENFHPTKDSAICEVHFESDQFEAKIPGKLKRDAIPTLFPYKKVVSHRKTPKDRSPGVSSLYLQTKFLNNVVTLEHSYPTSNRNIPENGALHTDVADISAGVVSDAPLLDDSTYKEKCFLLEAQIKCLNQTINALKREKEDLAKSVAAIFSSDQIKFLENPEARSTAKWSDDTVRKAAQIRFACGSAGYEMLLSHGYPLPSDRTLRRKLQHLHFNPGMLTEVMNMLAVKVQSMTEQEKKTAITIDEMGLQPSINIDPRNGSISGFATVPQSSKTESKNSDEDVLATHGLVVMLRGISTPWKQVEAYEFTANSWSAEYVKDFLFRVISESHKIGLDIKTVTMDMGGGNQGILRNLGIACQRTGPIINKCIHPLHKDRFLYIFPDVPHLIKNLRNHLSKGQNIIIPPSNFTFMKTKKIPNFQLNFVNCFENTAM